MSTPPLFKHQEKTVEFLRKNAQVLDLSDPGTGKTRSALEYINREGLRALVLCPLSIVNAAWEADARRFYPWMGVSVAYGNKRLDAFMIPARHAHPEVVVTNHDAVRWLVRSPTVMEDFDLLVVDEFTAFKNPQAQRSKMLAQVVPYFKKRLFMSGTPMANSPMDIWHPATMTDGGKRLGVSFHRFRERFCTGVLSYSGTPHMEWTPRPTAATDIMALLSDIVVRHKLKDCIDLPDRTRRQVPVKLSTNHQRHYDKFARNAMLHLHNKQAKAVNAGVLQHKLRQLASGAVYGEVGTIQVDASRFDLASMLVRENPGKTVIAFLWRFQRNLMITRLSRDNQPMVYIDSTVSMKKRSQAVERFQNGDARVMMLHPAAAAHGLTLTAANLLIWLSPTFSLEHHEQTNARIYRAGQKKNVCIMSMYSPDTVEDVVTKALHGKEAIQAKALALASNLSRSNLKKLLSMDALR